MSIKLTQDTKKSLEKSDDQVTQASKSQYSNTTPEVKPTPEKKDKGFLGFINQKLTQWPLWTKLTSYLTDNPQEVKKEVKKEETKKDQTKTQQRKPMKIKQLPWTMFMGRDRYQAVYDYYHCKQDNTTYFYQTTRTRIPWDSSILQMSKQIFAFPENHGKAICFAVPSEIAKPKMEAELQSRRKSRSPTTQ